MNKILIAALTLGTSLVSHASTIYATDPFNANDSCAVATPGCDVIGTRTEFDIQKADVTINANSATANLYFDFGSGSNLNPFSVSGIQLNVGDLFFTVNGVPQFAIPLVSHAGSPDGGINDGLTLQAGNLYQINNSNGLLTAQTVLNNPANASYRNNDYVWAYNDGDGSVTNVTSGTPQVIVSNNGDGVNQAKFQVQINFVPNATLLADSHLSNFGFVFESATCANDVIAGNAATVPEPLTFASLGSGLLLVSLLARFRRRSRPE